MTRTETIQRATDVAADGLQHREGGLAVYKAAELFGVTTGEVGKELAARRKAKRQAIADRLAGRTGAKTWTPYAD